MNNRKLFDVLYHNGLPYAEAQRIAAEVTAKEAPRVRVVRKNDWKWLLAPLIAQIKTLASSRHKWSKDPLRCPIYDKYLRLLRATRDQIKGAQALATLANKTIPQYASEYDIPRDGMVWDAWVPASLQSKVRLAFDRLALARTHDRRGKQLIPFSTHKQRTASNVRWDKLIDYLLVEVEIHGKDDTKAAYMRSINAALDICHKRGLTDVAPVKWQHLLSDTDQQILEKEKPAL